VFACFIHGIICTEKQARNPFTTSSFIHEAFGQPAVAIYGKPPPGVNLNRSAKIVRYHRRIVLTENDQRLRIATDRFRVFILACGIFEAG
jgi:hypothetical protein